MWALFFVVLFLFGLGFAPWSVLVAFQSCFRLFASLLFLLKGSLLYNTCRGYLFHWVLLLSLFLRPSSFLFYCCRNIVGLLSLPIVSVLGFRCGLPFYPGPHNSGTVDFVFQYGYLLCSECTSSVMFYAFFYLGLLVSGFVLFHISYGSFCSDCAFPGIGDMSQPVTRWLNHW